MRNLRGLPFPHRASDHELRRIERLVLKATEAAGLDFLSFRQISNAEREYLVGCRLASPDFEWNKPGRALLLDRPRALGIMVNEEDHIRLQALTAGWAVDAAEGLCLRFLESTGPHLDFAFTSEYGYLAASPYNAGQGRRLSVMLHLIGLAQTKRLPAVLHALTSTGIAARGLFGESSRAIGAFLQVSLIGGQKSAFVGACEHLMRVEREARLALDRDKLAERAKQAVDFAISSQSLTLADALRVLAWVRWAAAAELEGFPRSVREVDTMLTTMELRGATDEPKAARSRAQFLRNSLE